MDTFFNYKKRSSTTSSDAEEAKVSAKMLKSDAEYSTTLIGHSFKRLIKTMLLHQLAYPNPLVVIQFNRIYENMPSTAKERVMLDNL